VRRAQRCAPKSPNRAHLVLSAHLQPFGGASSAAETDHVAMLVQSAAPGTTPWMPVSAAAPKRAYKVCDRIHASILQRRVTAVQCGLYIIPGSGI
jgi:hypothetical protein